MPLTTAEIYAKIGVEEGQPLYLLAHILDEDAVLQGYGATLPPWVDGEEVATEHGRMLHAFTSLEKAEEFAEETSWPDHDPPIPQGGLRLVGLGRVARRGTMLRQAEGGEPTGYCLCRRLLLSSPPHPHHRRRSIR